MALSTAGVTARKLIEHGLDPATPVAIVENGTLPDEKTVTGRLADLESLIHDNRITGPALAIIGDVAALAHTETHDREALAV